MHDDGHDIVAGGDERIQTGDESDHAEGRREYQSERAAASSFWRAVCKYGIGDHGQRKTAVPKKIQPRSRLRPRAEQPRRREQAREAERVRDCHARAEEVRGGKDQKRAGAENRELPEQQHRGQQVDQHERRLVERQEGRQRGQQRLRERSHGEKRRPRHDDDPQRKAAVARSRLKRRQERPRALPHRATVFPLFRGSGGKQLRRHARAFCWGSTPRARQASVSLVARKPFRLRSSPAEGPCAGRF